MTINPGILLMILTAFFQSSMQAVVKYVSPDINTTIQLLAYYMIPLMIFIPLMMKQGLHQYKTSRFPFLLLRGIITTIAVFCFFYTAKHMNLAVGAVLFNTTPIFIPLLASIFLKEQTSPKTYLGIGISLLGVIIIIHPKSTEFLSLLTFVGLASGFLMAVSQVMLRYLAKLNESVDNIVFYLYLTCVISALFFITLEDFFSSHGSGLHFIHGNHDGFVYSGLLVLGFLSFFAQRILTKAFKYMPASKLAPYLYISIPISSIYGWIFWHQHINYFVLLGSALVVAGTCIITFNFNFLGTRKIPETP
jgi:drug/metabolite transporter (DMT)-like permease